MSISQRGSYDGAYVVFPGDGIEGDRVDILVEDEGKGDGEVENRESFGTERVRQDLDSVGDDERGEGEAS